MTLQTYLNRPQLKADFLAELAKHEEHDALIKGTYGTMNRLFKGCAIGCALHSLNILQGKVGAATALDTDKHARYEAELGLPRWFAYLEDQIFEELPDALAKTWPRRIAEAIPVGAIVNDLVLAKILRWMLADTEFGERHATDDDEVRGHIDGVIAGFDAEISTGCRATAEQREAAAMDARVSWVAAAAWGTWAARATEDVGDERWVTWTAGAAKAAWAGAATPASRAKADAFFPALSEYVLGLVRALPVTTVRRDAN